MVKFEKDKFVIEVPTTSPAEDWLELHDALCLVIRSLNHETIPENFWAVVNLLQDMMPDWQTAKKLNNK